MNALSRWVWCQAMVPRLEPLSPACEASGGGSAGAWGSGVQCNSKVYPNTSNFSHLVLESGFVDREKNIGHPQTSANGSQPI